MSKAFEVPAVNHVSDLKKADVKKLLGGIDLTEEATLFYNEVMDGDIFDSNDVSTNPTDDTEVDI